MHLLIPYAACGMPACRSALATLQLPQLAQLLGQLTPTERLSTPETEPLALVPPHETLHARALGLDDRPGHTPWAAQTAQQRQLGLSPGDAAWAWFTPCHWQTGMDSVVMADPDALALTEAESRTLLATLAPYLAEDGIQLHWVEPGRWLACGEPLRDLACASLDRVLGQNVRPWEPSGPGARLLRRLQSEVQMLLYTHPVNDERSARGLWPINAFWISGAGALTATPSAPAQPLIQPDALRGPALHDDARAWAAAWAQIDAQACADLRRELERGQPVRLTLCSERSAQTYEPRPRSLWARLTQRPPTVAAALQALLPAP